MPLGTRPTAGTALTILHVCSTGDTDVGPWLNIISALDIGRHSIDPLQVRNMDDTTDHTPCR